jgi:hypothetical protein
MCEENKKTDDCCKKMNANLEQYKLAISLWNAQHQAIWGMFSNVILANSIFIAAITLLLSKENYTLSNVAGLFLSTTAIIVNIFWYAINSRGYRFQDFRIRQALKYENDMKNPSDNIQYYDLVNDGQIFADECPRGYKCIELDKKLGTHFFNRRYCNIKTKISSKLILLLFILIYIGLSVIWGFKLSGNA